MYDNDRRAPTFDIPDHPTELELRLQEYDWSDRPAEIDGEDLENALAVLAVLETEEDDFDDEPAPSGSLWLQ